MFGFGKEKREAVQFTQATRETFLQIVGMDVAGDTISPSQALGVPAVWAAINFLSGTIAGLPLHVYDRQRDGTKRKVRATDANKVVPMLHDAVNEETSSFKWRFDMFSTGVLTEGRFVTYIERDDLGRPINLYPLPKALVKMQPDGRKVYEYQASGGRKRVYQAGDVLDVPFLLKDDLVSHQSPLRNCIIALSKAYNTNKFGSKIFANGGMPPFALQGPFGSEKSAMRASEDISRATKEAAQKGHNVLSIPVGHKLDPLGTDPEKMQMIESQRFAVEEVARIYGLPPTFLQDLTHGTFSNTEQQDLHFVKHTLKRWVEQLEQEMNLKFFGRGSRRFVEFNVDGLLRGDYKTRMEGNSTAIQTGQLTPNEARAMDNREPQNGGDRLFIQGATVPLETQEGQLNET